MPIPSPRVGETSPAGPGRFEQWKIERVWGRARNAIKRFSVEGKVALVTGGAGLYGRQIVLGLAEAGARTYIASRNLDALEALAAEHRDQGHDVLALKLDQENEASIAAARDPGRTRG